MEQNLNKPPKPENWNSLPIPIKIYIGWIIFRSVHWTKIEKILVENIQRIDIWLFPPLAFFGAYKSMIKIVPEGHPMALVTVLGTCFMCVVLVQLIVRPRKIFSWIRNFRF